MDILFAVALGAGFMAGVYKFKDRLISAEVFTFGEDGPGFYRVVLAFLIIILSWIYYRRSTLEGRQYPPAAVAAYRPIDRRILLKILPAA